MASGFSSRPGRTSASTHEARVEIRLRDSTLNAVSRDRLLILDDLVFDVIFGLDWLSQHEASLDLRQNKLHFTTFGTVPILGLPRKYDKSAKALLCNMTSIDAPPGYDEDTPWGNSPDFEEIDEDRAVTKEELKNIPEEFHGYASVFSKKRADVLPPLREQVDLRIDLVPDAVQRMPRPRAYQTGRREAIALSEYLDDMLKKGFITPTRSPIGSPAFFVPKPHSDELRFVVDYKRLNAVTVKDKYALPLISDILNALANRKIFSKIDLRGAYHLMRIREDDQWKTAFTTTMGSFEYRVMPFGLSNAPPAFQRWINSIFQDLMPQKAMVYLDDIVLYSQDRESHTSLIHEVLSRLRGNKLYASPKKCEFYKDTITYLGHVISTTGITIDPAKVQSVIDWPIPNSIKTIQRFLGFANYSRNYLKTFAVKSAPLTKLLRKSEKERLALKSDVQKFDLPQDAIRAFNDMKTAFTTAPILAHWDMSLDSVIETDASGFAIGAILSQRPHGRPSELRPIAYLSRSFSAAEFNYDVHDKEMLSIIEAFRNWRHLLTGCPNLEVQTDHKNLEYFQTTKILTPRQVRWSQFLAQFRFTLVYRSGQENGRCDALSRRSDREEETMHLVSSMPQNISDETGVRRRARPQALIQGSLFGPDYRSPGMGGEGGGVRLNPISPLNTTHQYTRFTVEEDDLSKEVKQASRDLPPDEWKRLREGAGFCSKVKDARVLWFEGKLFVPDKADLRTKALRQHHDTPEAGHWGTRKTRAILHRHYAWPGDVQDVKDYVASCKSCARVKTSRLPGVPLRPLELAQRPWQSVSMDRITQLPPSQGFTSILVIVDRFSKTAVFLPVLENFSAEDLATDFVREVAYRYGCPLEVVSDRGPEFAAKLWKDVCEKLGIKIKLSTAYHPQTDGQTERTNQTLEIYLRHYVGYHQDNWASWLPAAAFCYNTTPHSATQHAPYEVLYNYLPELRNINITELNEERGSGMSNELRSEVAKHLQDAKDASESLFNSRKRDLPEWKVGDRVWLSTRNLRVKRPTRKLGEAFCGPFTVLEKISTHAYRLELPATMRIHNVFHVSLLKRFTPNRFEGRELPPPPPIMVEEEEEYVVEDIVAEQGDPEGREYLVKWKGYAETFNTWEPAGRLADTEALDRWETARKNSRARVSRQRGNNTRPSPRRRTR